MTLTTTQENTIQLLKNGPRFIELYIELILKAEKFILLHSYIFEDDEITEPIIQALISQSQKNIPVFVILDAFGSGEFSTQTVTRLQEAHINFNFFSPFFKFKKIAQRLHQKLLLIDNKYAVVGGINLSKQFNSPDQGAPWLDYACLIEGIEVQEIFCEVLPLYLKSFQKRHKQLNSFLALTHQVKGPVLLKTNSNDWTQYKNNIYQSYIIAIRKAQTDIYILATYFIPGKRLLKELRNAKRRGVNIHLIFGKLTDHPIVNLAIKYFYDWYLEQGFQIYEWDKSIIHGKLALIDDRWVTIGSYNHNYVSRYGNLELNIEVINNEFAAIVKDEFITVTRHSEEITSSNFKKDFKHLVLTHLTFFLTNILTLISLLILYKRDEMKDIN